MPAGQKRKDIQLGSRVRIVEKKNQGSGKLTEGNVERILTGSLHHPHGIKVQLKGGAIGRVKEILDGSAPANSNAGP
ncbi:MAG: YwbE family protein [Nitrososphaera sp.]